MKILLIRSGGIGDCILTLPVAVHLRERYPESELHVLGNGNMLTVARLTGMFSGFRSLDEAGFSALFAGGGTVPFLRAFLPPFDRVYCFSAGDPESITLTVLDSGAGYCRVLDPRPPQGRDAHISGHLLSILGPDRFRPAALPPLPSALPRSRRSGPLVIHPGSGGLSKTWPLERFLTVAEEWPGEVVFLLGPAEMERGFAGKIPERFRTVPDPLLSGAAAILTGARVFLGNDSGASHLAALCGTPAVVLFGPTDPRIWRPLGDTVRVIVSKNGRMEGIGVEEVIDAVGNGKGEKARRSKGENPGRDQGITGM